MAATGGQVVEPGFEGVADRFPRWLRGGRGGALAVVHRGRVVLDTWTGLRDVRTRAPWEGDTVTMAWSTTKGVTSAAAHVLVQRGVLGLDDRVADHWPAFAANGKARTTVRHVLAQEAGLHDIRHLVPDARSLLDHTEVASALAASAPAHPPGAANGYHALTYGYLVDELVRRSTGRTLAAVVQEEIARPLDLDGFTIGSDGVPAERIAPAPPFADLGPGVRRLAKIVGVGTRLPPVRVDLGAIASAFVPHGGELIGTPPFLASGNGSIGGLFTARALARLYANLIGAGGAGSGSIWTPDTLERATTPVACRRDRVLSVRPLWTAGFHRPWPRSKLGTGSFGFFGMFGSGAWADPGRHLAVALVTPDASGMPLVAIGKAVIAAAEGR